MKKNDGKHRKGSEYEKCVSVDRSLMQDECKLNANCSIVRGDQIATLTNKYGVATTITANQNHKETTDNVIPAERDDWSKNSAAVNSVTGPGPRAKATRNTELQKVPLTNTDQ